MTDQERRYLRLVKAITTAVGAEWQQLMDQLKKEFPEGPPKSIIAKGA